MKDARQEIIEKMMEHDPKRFINALTFSMKMLQFEEEIKEIDDFMKLYKVDLVRLLTTLIGLIHA